MVADDGPGIPAGDRDRALRRFVRLEASRSTPGSGLGLSLVAAIAGLHGVALGLGDNRPGLAVSLGFPACDVRKDGPREASSPRQALQHLLTISPKSKARLGGLSYRLAVGFHRDATVGRTYSRRAAQRPSAATTGELVRGAGLRQRRGMAGRRVARPEAGEQGTRRASAAWESPPIAHRRGFHPPGMRPGRLPRPVFILDTAHAPDCRLGTVTTSVAFLAAIYAVVAYLTVSKADRIAPHAYRKGRDDEATSPKPLLLAAAGADREADLIQLEQA